MIKHMESHGQSKWCYFYFCFERQAFAVTGLLLGMFIVTSLIFLKVALTNTDQNFSHSPTQTVSQNVNFFYDLKEIFLFAFLYSSKC